MSPDEIVSERPDFWQARRPITRPDPAPFVPGDPRDIVRADLHQRFTGVAHGSWDYVESHLRDDILVVRLVDDRDGPINIEVDLGVQVDPEDWQFLDTWIVELMDSGRPEPASVADGVITYRLD